MTSIGSLQDEIDLENRERKLEEELNKIDSSTDQLERSKLGKKILLAAEKGKLLELTNILNLDNKLIDYTDSDGYTALHRASYGGHRDCVKYLLKRGANLKAKTTDGWTPLHCAARWNNIDVAECLLEKGADINAKSSGGNTPLHLAASNGRYSLTCDLVQLLLFHPDCDYKIRNDSGDTAFDVAKRSGPFYKFWNGVTNIYPDGLELNEGK